MCLDRGSVLQVLPNTLIQSGWKVFIGNIPAEFRFENQRLRGEGTVPLDRWIVAERNNVGEYFSGFHIYEDETESGVGGKMRRVYYRKAEWRGKQNGKTVIVAQEMFVPRHPDDWPPKG